MRMSPRGAVTQPIWAADFDRIGANMRQCSAINRVLALNHSDFTHLAAGVRNAAGGTRGRAKRSTPSADRFLGHSERDGLALGQLSHEVALDHLLDQIEEIQKLAYLRDPAVAEGAEQRDVDLHDTVIASLA